jgi:hypothetical protein
MQDWTCSKLKLRKSVLATKWSPGGRYIVFTGVKQVRVNNRYEADVLNVKLILAFAVSVDVEDDRHINRVGGGRDTRDSIRYFQSKRKEQSDNCGF